jgi:hypothetical protein
MHAALVFRGQVARSSIESAFRYGARVAGTVPQVPTTLGIWSFIAASRIELTLLESEFMAGLRKRFSNSEISSFFSFAVKVIGTWYCWSTVRLTEDSASPEPNRRRRSSRPNRSVGVGGILTRTVSPGL